MELINGISKRRLRATFRWISSMQGWSGWCALQFYIRGPEVTECPGTTAREDSGSKLQPVV